MGAPAGGSAGGAVGGAVGGACRDGYGETGEWSSSEWMTSRGTDPSHVTHCHSRHAPGVSTRDSTVLDCTRPYSTSPDTP